MDKTDKKGVAIRALGELKVEVSEESTRRMLEVMVSALEAVEVDKKTKEQGTQLHEDILKAINQSFEKAEKISELKEKYALKTVEVAQLYGMSRTTLEQWRSQGRGPRFFQEGRLVLYRAKDIDDYLDGGIVRTIDQP